MSHVALLFWLALLLPGYAAVRSLSDPRRWGGLMGTLALSYLASFALLMPFSLAGYLLSLPIWTFSAACVLLCAAGVVVMTVRGWWGEFGRLAAGLLCFELLIILADVVLSARLGTYLHLEGDSFVHLGRVRFLLDHGFSNLDPYYEVALAQPYYHTNLVHALYAACTQLTPTDHIGVWYGSLPWARVLVASAGYFLGWCVFERAWAAWAVALFLYVWRAPITFTLYPNQLAMFWLTPVALGLVAAAVAAERLRRLPAQLALVSVLLGQVHAMYAIFLGITLAPFFVVAAAASLGRGARRPWVWLFSLAALFGGAPFAAASLWLKPRPPSPPVATTLPTGVASRPAAGAVPAAGRTTKPYEEPAVPSAATAPGASAAHDVQATPSAGASSAPAVPPGAVAMAPETQATMRPVSATAAPRLSGFIAVGDRWCYLRLGSVMSGPGRFALCALGVGTAALLCTRRRRAAGPVLAAAGVVLCIYWIPPLCAATIDTLGAEWMLIRMKGYLYFAFALAVPGLLAYLLDPLGRAHWHTLVKGG